WDKIEIISTDFTGNMEHPIQAGDDCSLRVVLDLKDLVGSVGVEFLVTKTVGDRKELKKYFPLKVTKVEGTRVYYETEGILRRSGHYEVAFRMYPVHPDLPHRMDFCYVRWF
ncbi:MAG TPA: DUF3417 domain-containing protein, partial [Porphyromonadaceae bacterium]|nr:DUF3417 domain-containing protein [Porphyromonadaceae bacterium]